MPISCFAEFLEWKNKIFKITIWGTFNAKYENYMITLNISKNKFRWEVQ